MAKSSGGLPLRGRGKEQFTKGHYLRYRRCHPAPWASRRTAISNTYVWARYTLCLTAPSPASCNHKVTSAHLALQNGSNLHATSRNTAFSAALSNLGSASSSINS